jgi:2-(1,2-epoxy-1,2-dihydrophenyl)acetyl-CoA isomerase
MSQVQTIETGTGQLLCTLKDRVMTVTLNRPEARNALSEELSPAFRRMIARAAEDDDVGALLVTGAGGAFCAGGDVKGMGERRKGLDKSGAERYDIMLARHRGLGGALYALRKPTIAAIPGPAVGAGLAIALTCDIRLAGATAFLGTGYARVGLSGDYAIAWLLTRAVGPSRARALMLTNERVTAQRAMELGMVHRVVGDDELQSEAFMLARSLAEGPSVAYRYMKDNLDEALDIDHATAIEHEAERILRAQTTEDHKEAVRAFVEKRKPAFKGR